MLFYTLITEVTGGRMTIAEAFIYLLLILLSLLIAISFHEWAHAFAAHKLGDDTAKNVGRMTLDPIKHIDPIGAIMLLIIGFGWAKPVPVNVNNFKHRRRDENIVSLAGVFTNFVLAFLLAGVYALISLITYTSSLFLANLVRYFGIFLIYAMMYNISLGIFNLIPIPPLDGYHILRGLLVGRVQPQKLWNFERYARYGFIILLGISFLMNIIFGMSLFSFLSVAVDWIMNGFVSFWQLFI